MAGVSCQPFSSAGTGEGFFDEKGRGSVFFSLHEYIATKRPKVFILENVDGIVKLERGQFLDVILKTLQSITQRGQDSIQAYEIHHTILNRIPKSMVFPTTDRDGTVWEFAAIPIKAKRVDFGFQDHSNAHHSKIS